MSESIYTLRVSRAAAGAYPTISDALAAADQLYPDAEQPVMIRVEPGEYRERVEIRRPHVTIEGETADSVRIVGSLGAKMLLNLYFPQANVKIIESFGDCFTNSV